MAPTACSNIRRISYFIESQTPLTLMAITASKLASVCSAKRPGSPSIPALLKAISSRSYVLHRVVHQRFDISRDQDVGPFKTGCPAGVTNHRDCFLAALNIAITNDDLRPFASKRDAVARPIPDPPPVTNATFPSNSFMKCSSYFQNVVWLRTLRDLRWSSHSFSDFETRRFL